MSGIPHSLPSFDVHPQRADTSWRGIDAYLRARGVRIGPPIAVQTTGGKHAPGSYHYSGTALDYALYDSDASAVARTLKPLAHKVNSPIAELFFAPLNIWFKHGWPIPGWFVGGHQDHCHVALETGRHLSLPAHAAKKRGGMEGLLGAMPPNPGGHQTVGMGSAGPEVRDLQTKLTKAGYHLVPDGMFGPKTLAAVRAFQAKKRLEVDGVAGPRTWQALDADSPGFDLGPMGIPPLGGGGHGSIGFESPSAGGASRNTVQSASPGWCHPSLTQRSRQLRSTTPARRYRGIRRSPRGPTHSSSWLLSHYRMAAIWLDLTCRSET
jgi:hypothetical protein